MRNWARLRAAASGMPVFSSFLSSWYSSLARMAELQRRRYGFLGGE
jgi:hypothetical protein